ncbi:MAG: recombinase family protein [Heteroscytonema crispum UTEX LB 1556]
MVSDSLWIVGASRSGKTARLVEQFCSWVQSETVKHKSFYTKIPGVKKGERIPKRLFLNPVDPGVLVFAANNESRRELGDRIVTTTLGKYPVRAKTPLGFFQDEVILFWPLLIKSLHLKAQFPVRLRPETEQELATKLWRPSLDEEILRLAGVSESRLVRRILDLLQLAAYSGTPCEEIASVLAKGLKEQENGTNLEPEFLGSLLRDWRNWCLQRGMLTYGIITELYAQHLLSDRNYQEHLTKRYQAVLADDVDEYPAVARSLFELLLERDAVGAFSYNSDGGVRLGLGADPNYMEGLAGRCRVELLNQPPLICLADILAKPMVELVTEPMALLSLPEDVVQSIQTTSRAQLLRKTAEEIVDAIKLGKVEPQEVAIIAPGLDAIARYTLIEILGKQGIFVESLNDQRPLISSPIIRALLTMLALVYPGLGRLVDRDSVAQMLVVLSRRGGVGEQESRKAGEQIDPVRAGLIADYCFVPHPDHPNLLPVTTFDRWDRIGYCATRAYEQILQWLEKQRSNYEKRLIPSPISLLYSAIEDFVSKVGHIPYEQIAALRELLETAQHYWEIDTRLRQTLLAEGDDGCKDGSGGEEISQLILAPTQQVVSNNTVADFIQLLRRGTITANPYPVRPIGPAAKAVTLATIFQYRSSRRSHRWHFWLDASSPLWAKGGAATLFGAPLFLQDRLGEPWTAEDEKMAQEQRLRRILADLLARVSEKVYLCHSDLAVNGQEQLGPLLPLVNACMPVVTENVVI